MITEVEPLTIPHELRAESLVDLVHRTVQRNPDKEALRWKLPRSGRQMGGPDEEERRSSGAAPPISETWRWITQVAMGLKHLGIRDGDSGGDHVAHAPGVADRGHRRHVAGRGHLPDLPLIRARPGGLRDQQRRGPS